MIVPDTINPTTLDAAGRSKYKALAQSLREGIVSGALAVGEKLPPVRELAYQVGVTPGTVARAYALLIDEGRLVAGVGRGTFVAEREAAPKPNAPWLPPMHDPVVDAAEKAHLLSPKIPDCGQVQIIRDGLSAMGESASDLTMLRYPSRQTDLAARNAFCNQIDLDHTGPCKPDDVVVSHGGQNAILMILQTILQGQNPTIAVDDLSYGGFRSAAMLGKADVVGVPWDDDGPRLDVLEQLIREQGVKVFCTSAEVCNPTTLTTSIARRQSIARLAIRYGVHILDDDCYRLMRSRYTGPSYRALAPDLGWYVTSPSKSLTAALRIGFAIAPKGWGAQLVRTATFNSFGVSGIVTDLYCYILAHPDLENVLRRVKARVAEDVRAAVNILGGHAVSWSEDVPFVWLALPRGWRAGEFCQAAEGAGVLLKSADDFALRDSRSTHAVRIAVNGWVGHDHFVEAMNTLRQLLDRPPGQLSV